MCWQENHLCEALWYGQEGWRYLVPSMITWSRQQDMRPVVFVAESAAKISRNSTLRTPFLWLIFDDTYYDISNVKESYSTTSTVAGSKSTAQDTTVRQHSRISRARELYWNTTPLQDDNITVWAWSGAQRLCDWTSWMQRTRYQQTNCTVYNPTFTHSELSSHIIRSFILISCIVLLHQLHLLPQLHLSWYERSRANDWRFIRCRER